jgi:hypothetical protein
MSSATRTARATGRRTLMAVGTYCFIAGLRRTKCARCCIETCRRFVPRQYRTSVLRSTVR